MSSNGFKESTMSVQVAPDIEEEYRIAEVWLAKFADALTAEDATAVAALFIPDGHWRDVLAFTWNIGTHSGRAAIASALQPTLARVRARELRTPDHRSPPRLTRRAGTECIETIFEFDTASGHANAVVRLVRSEGGWRAWTLLTTLETLHGWPDGRPPELSDAERYSRDFGGENWLDQRQRALAYTDREPAVVVIGGGQGGPPTPGGPRGL